MFCCQTCGDEARESEADHFDCAACPLATALASLDDDNAEAWRIYGRVYTRLNVDWGLVTAMCERLMHDLDDDEMLLLLDRLGVIYSILNPPHVPQQD